MVTHPGLTPAQRQRRKRQEMAYEKAVQMLETLRRANLDMTKEGQNLHITVTDGLGRTSRFTFDLDQPGHNAVAEEIE